MSFKNKTYVPHQGYLNHPRTNFHKPLPAQPEIPTISVEPASNEKDYGLAQEVPTPYLQPVTPAHNPRARQQYLPHGAAPLMIQGLSPVPSNFTNVSPHSLSPGSFGPSSPRRSSMRIVHSDLKSTWSETSLVQPPSFILKLREFITKYFIEWWLAEILSWLFSALCFCTIIAVLFYFDRRPLPNWPMGLTLNAFISVFSGLAKSALLLPTCEAIGQLKWNWFNKEERSLIDFEIMDAASRGPCGSFLLLLRSIRQRGLALASIGAGIIILSLPFDLFFQQVISYPTVWLPFQPNSTIAIANTYRSPGLVFVNGTASIAIEPQFSPVLTQLFYTNSSVPKVASFCPANNCTWQPYDTIAVCSMCEDTVSDFLDFGCFESTGDWLTDSTTIYEPLTVPNITSCGYWLNVTSDDRVLMTGYVVDPITGEPGETLDSRIYPLVDALTRERKWGGSIRFKDLSDPLIDVFIAGTPGGAAAVHARARPIIQECALTWCTHSLNTTVAWGTIQETPISTFIDRSSKGSNWTTLDCPECLNGVDYYYLKNISLPAASMHSQTENIDTIPAQDMVMGLSNETMMSTIFALDDLAPSFFTTSNSSGMRSGDRSESFFKYKTFFPRGANTMSIAVNPWLPPFDIATRMDEMAQAMTAIVRNNPAEDGDLKFVEGASWNAKVFVGIRWGWIIMPMCLLALGLGLLCVTVLRSSRESSLVGIWKNSVVAILFNGLDEQTQKSVTPNCGLVEARLRARELQVKIVPD